jgi:hypothetical protein
VTGKIQGLTDTLPDYPPQLEHARITNCKNFQCCSAKQPTVIDTDLCGKIVRLRNLSEDERSYRIRGVTLVCVIFYNEPFVHLWLMVLLMLILHYLNMNTIKNL